MATFSAPSESSSGSEVEVNWAAEDEEEYVPRHSLGFYAAAADLGYRLHTETLLGRRVA